MKFNVKKFDAKHKFDTDGGHTLCRSYVKVKWKRYSEISRPILVFRPRPITANFFEVPNKTWMGACSDINQSLPAQQSTHLIECIITIDACVWAQFCILTALYCILTTNP